MNSVRRALPLLIVLPLVALAAVSGTATQSATTTITPATSISCNASSLHAENSYYRIYDLSSVITSGTIPSVTFGVEQAIGAGGSQGVTVNLWSYDTGTPFVLANLSLLGGESFVVGDTSLAEVTATFSTPVAVADTSNAVVVELLTPDGQAAGNSFFIGANEDGQTGPGYIRAPACGLSEPLSLVDIGFPTVHIRLDLAYEGEPPGGGGDADGDGIPDEADFCFGDGPFDSDGDSVCDGDDVCTGADDTIDSDADSIPDGCDACAFDGPTGEDDDDGDGVCDSYDACVGNDASGNGDGDGLCDDLDYTLTVTNPLFRGGSVTLTVTGAPANQVVFFGVSSVGPGNGPCALSQDGSTVCSGLRQVQTLGKVRTNGAGSASLTITLPPGVRVGDDLWFRSAHLRGSGDVTPIVQREVQAVP